VLKAGAMGLLRGQFERRLSSMLGADVRFEKLNISLLGGTLDVEGITVSSPGEGATPLLTVKRVRAEVSIAAALKKEFVVKSLTIEKPVLTVVRDANGQLNLPPKLSDTSATPRQTSDATSDTRASEDGGGSWKLDAKRVLVVDGEVHYREASGYHASLERLLAELKQVAGGFEFTLMADSAGRRDVEVPLGSLKMNGTLSNAPTLAQLQNASIAGSFEFGDVLRGKIEVPSIKPLEVKTDLQGTFKLDLIRKLLPSRQQ
jgi:uncharacterized protein involved in outer membrane biogenesis